MSDEHRDLVAVEWTVPHTGDKVVARIVSHTATTAVVDWGEGRTETVRFADPMLRWLTEEQIEVNRP